MRLVILATLSAYAFARPSFVEEREAGPCSTPATLDASKNVWLNYTLHPHSVYRSRYLAAAERINNTEWQKKALKVANSGTFLWMYDA